MALTLHIETNQSVELEESLELLDRDLEPEDYEGLAEAAVLLKKLANNRKFLVKHINDSLQSDYSNALGDTSFFLARRGRLYLRANVWAPPDEVASRRWQANFRSYLIPHDHPFSFVTVGYLGPGYTTTIFEYDRARIRGHLGEKVAFRPLETTTLTEGKVMLYRASKDVHCQAHPEKFSISLNLMVFPAEARNQFGFDVERGRIIGRAVDFQGAQATLCKMAAVLGDGTTANVLEKVARRNSDAEIRFNAFAALVQLDRTRAADIWSLALADSHEYVRLRAQAELTRLS